MKKHSNSFGGYEFASNKIQYGKQNGIEGKWREIVAIEDKTSRNAAIDALLDIMEQNKETNGFFGKNDEIDINILFGNRMVIDDKELYYGFFDKLKQNFEQDNGQSSSGYITLKSILDTQYEYLGTPSKDETKRRVVSNVFFNEEDEPVIPSIKKYKGQNCAACVEFASVSHNLWLIMGATSHYIVSSNIDIEGETGAHAYNILEYGGKYRLFDVTLKNIVVLEGNPIETIMQEKPLNVGNYVYANADKVQNQNK